MTTTTVTEDKPEETEDGEETAGNLPGYLPTREDRWIKVVYGDWVHSNDGSYLSGGVDANQEWQARWRKLAVMPAQRYDAPSGRVESCFVQVLSVEILGV